MRRRCVRWLFALALGLGCTAKSASAGSISFFATGSDSDGAISATVLFTAVNGGINVTLINNETDTLSVGQAISELSFQTGGGIGVPTSFTSLTILSDTFDPTASWDFTGQSSITEAVSSNQIDHWKFSTSGSTVSLATAGNGAPGGQPDDLILPTKGTAGSGSSLNGPHNPYIVGPATFFLADSLVTATTDLTNAQIAQVKIGFGTAPDKTLTSPGGTPSSSAAPLPRTATTALALLAMFFGAGYAVRRRNAAIA